MSLYLNHVLVPNDASMEGIAAATLELRTRLVREIPPAARSSWGLSLDVPHPTGWRIVYPITVEGVLDSLYGRSQMARMAAWAEILANHLSGDIVHLYYLGGTGAGSAAVLRDGRPYLFEGSEYNGESAIDQVLRTVADTNFEAFLAFYEGFAAGFTTYDEVEYEDAELALAAIAQEAGDEDKYRALGGPLPVRPEERWLLTEGGFWTAQVRVMPPRMVSPAEWHAMRAHITRRAG